MSTIPPLNKQRAAKEPSVHQWLANPPNLARCREDLFVLSAPITLTQEAFQMYWSYVSNIWSKESTRALKNGVVVAYYNCRLRRRTWKPDINKVDRRIRPVRNGSTCQAACRVEWDTAAASVKITLIATSTGHTHSLDNIDQLKKNDGLRADVERIAGLVPDLSATSLLASLRAVGSFEDGARQLEDAGGRYLTAKDVANWLRPSCKGRQELLTQGNHDPTGDDLPDEVLTHMYRFS
jgi:2,5-diamino-6-(ribosylamino)-4(3H)-pyrimidinone 5'-phosphate reductase